MRTPTIPPDVKPAIPGPGQESVWDYPRPPRVEPTSERVRVVVESTTVGDSVRAVRVLEFASPPVYYLPPDDVRLDLLEESAHATVCEWKGQASYYSLVVGSRKIANAAWTYRDPSSGYESIRGYVAFYAGLVDEAYVGRERVLPQPGRFYGGWITSRVVGPFKGPRETADW